MNKLIALIAGGIVAASTAQAATVSFSGSIPLTSTNWNLNITLQQFDPSLGTLTAIKFIYDGGVSTDFQFESLDAAAATVNMNAAANLNFGGPISSLLALAAATSQPVSAFDGTIDFGGTSGASVLDVSDSDSGSVTLLGGFAPYVGLGTFDIAVAAAGLSNLSGAGNLLAIIRTEAEASIKVEYTYDTPGGSDIPVPATVAIFGASLIGLGLASRRKAA